ncbi:MAG: hypothetical protein MRJ68_16485 [Nitrospira sp.]|nr:hypothetical protein [Nitrospira sp.]
MPIILVFIVLFPSVLSAQEIMGLDHRCVAESVRRCMGNFAGHNSSATCPAGELPVPVGAGDGGGNCISLLRPPDNQQVLGGIVKKRNEAFERAGKPAPYPYAEEVARFEWCEKVVLYTLAEKDSCLRSMPSAGHFDSFNKAFLDKFTDALEKAFPPEAAKSSASPTPIQGQAKP